MRPIAFALMSLLSTITLQAFAEQGDAEDRALIDKAATEQRAAVPRQPAAISATKKDDAHVMDTSYPTPASAP